MTAAIKSSLNDLSKALDTLEESASNMQKEASKPRKRTSPPDLFSVTSATQADVDTKALASRLDGAIAKVEKLLRDEE